MLTVFAASSLTDAFVELEGMFEEQNTGIDVSPSFAGSSELLAQIQQGAPADVFASADEAKMDTALEEGLVAEPEIFARNRPVIIVPAADLGGIAEFRDLAEADAQMVLAEEAVPIALGEVYIVRSRITCNIGVPRYAKVEIIGLEANSLTLKVLANNNCGYRGLEPGFPDR